MPPRTSKNSANVPTSPPKSPPKSHRSARKHAASSVDASVEPAAKKVAMDSEVGKTGGEGEDNEGGATGKKGDKGNNKAAGKKGKKRIMTSRASSVKAAAEKVAADHLTKTQKILLDSGAAIAPPPRPVQGYHSGIFHQ
ncbi:uncharacterized protein LACBIDRAFT_329783 [Laccaria bicolor S238N-H82]|uniref:Predicted protein n=1 Tax=Laccaria bicolor (strain S238N-H82 / ATCC MYA-4686) TaxID=486041 RepID=B0DJ82_LACBS|nr:uncharacterized protein LACBIDRAFT_329783 [Laccaria bicolor S238N-H82]EDR05475.1 predicted protein [Laccaria bicolor S238N-H82]|eukprot:XP_001884033.1 predicted protein [Laccaria bicolor S238N-H82]